MRRERNKELLIWDWWRERKRTEEVVLEIYIDP
jgi:hypothetical protein